MNEKAAYYKRNASEVGFVQCADMEVTLTKLSVCFRSKFCTEYKQGSNAYKTYRRCTVWQTQK
ncbi:hypothetical protein D3C73_1531920 [compost metagenome]